MRQLSLPSGDELAALVEQRASDGSSAARLRVALHLGRQLTDSGEALIERFVAEARADGMSWTQIGDLFGTSKQAAQKRYAAKALGTWPGRWSAVAAQVLEVAVEQAQRTHHDYVGTEHVLVALLATRDSVAGQILLELGLVRDLVLAELSGPPCVGGESDGLKVMPRLRQSLEYAQRIAAALGDPVADSEHLLAGILAVPEALAVHILVRQGVDPDDLRGALAGRLGVDPGQLVVARTRRRRLLARA